MSNWRELVDTVRKDCPTVTWGRGIQLSRSAKVVCESMTSDEVVLKVLTPGKTLARTVSFFLDDEDWHCDCSTREAPCEHLVAAVLSLKNETYEGGTEEEESSTSTIGYRFKRVRSGLAFRRVIRVGKDEIPLHQSVSAAARESHDGHSLVVSAEDLAVGGGRATSYT